MNVNITGTDSMVGEYLICKSYQLTADILRFFIFFVSIRHIDRGFTQTFQSLEQEKNRDRTKRFEVFKIVEVPSDPLFFLLYMH